MCPYFTKPIYIVVTGIILVFICFFLLNNCIQCLLFLLQVQDLHSITPDYFLEVSGAVVHPLSYQQVG